MTKDLGGQPSPNSDYHRGQKIATITDRLTRVAFRAEVTVGLQEDPVEKPLSATEDEYSKSHQVGSGERGQLRALNIDTVKELWSKTYNAQGKPDWSHIYPYYHPQIIFQDSIQRVEGIEAFVNVCERLARRCEKLQMEIRSIAQSSNMIFMDWTMTMVFKRTPSTPVYGCTKLTLHEDGRIIEQRDYYDLWGDIFNGIPLLKRPYRSFMRRVFG